jgi:hypothetical protein
VKRGAFAVVLAGFAFAGFGACSSDESGDGAAMGGTGGTGGTDASSEASPTQGCVQPGDHGNELGIGEYCTPGGHECDAFSGSAPLCLAEAAPTDDQWFCTRIFCNDDSVCGTNAFCLMTDRGSACVPTRCGGPNG